MHITNIVLKNVKVIECLDTQLTLNINNIFGDNGSDKTTNANTSKNKIIKHCTV